MPGDGLTDVKVQLADLRGIVGEQKIRLDLLDKQFDTYMKTIVEAAKQKRRDTFVLAATAVSSVGSATALLTFLFVFIFHL